VAAPSGCPPDDTAPRPKLVCAIPNGVPALAAIVYSGDFSEDSPLAISTGNCVAAWTGHWRLTNDALMAIMLKAHVGCTQFSRGERVLFTACEFWAAARHKELGPFLACNIARKLQNAEMAFATIGCVRIPRILQDERHFATSASLVVQLKRISTRVEVSLERTDEPVDQLLAQFAGQLTHVERDELVSIPRLIKSGTGMTMDESRA